MIISLMDIFYIAMIGIIFGFIIHLETQVNTMKTMIEEYLGQRNGKKIKSFLDIYVLKLKWEIVIQSDQTKLWLYPAVVVVIRAKNIWLVGMDGHGVLSQRSKEFH